MAKTKMTYMPLEMADKLDNFIVKRDEQVHNAVKVQARQYNTLTMLKLLYQLKNSPSSFTILYKRSEIRMKRSFLSYLNFCTRYEFVNKVGTGKDTRYYITDRGSTMLGLFMIKETITNTLSIP